MRDFLSVSAAADELGVHPSRVRALIASGALSAEKVSGAWLVDRAGIAGRARQQAPAGRPLSPHNAWALLLAASGEDLPSGLEPSARWRIRRALDTYGLDALHPRLVRRAEPSSYWVLPGEMRAMRERSDLVLSGPSAAATYDLGLVGSDAIDAYVPARLVASLQREHAMERMSGPESNVVVRAVPNGAWLLDGRRSAPLAAVAVDLCSYADPRAARIGADLIARIDHELKTRESTA
ncbi:MAG TPA: helix-turn-helix domain-containing protein [Solirubrobacteraceae bacterium]|nr:helix-turn-helix domain-containing protein [Solirubrobacteraceae bacterium]